MIESISFNITKYASISNTSVLNTSDLNSSPEKVLQISQHWTGVYNPHSFGILYFEESWFIVNLDLNDFPVNASFNVYFQEQGKSAFRHTATVANTFDNFTYLNNSLINGIPCARIRCCLRMGLNRKTHILV